MGKKAPNMRFSDEYLPRGKNWGGKGDIEAKGLGNVGKEGKRKSL